MTKLNKNMNGSTDAKVITRRQVLVRLGVATNIIYATPCIFKISAAHASGSSGASSSSGPSGGGAGGGEPSGSSSGPSGGTTGPSASSSGPSNSTSGPSGSIDGAAARKAVRNKKILTLRKIIRSVEKETGADVISHKLRLVNKKYIYHLKIVTREGAVKKIMIDASNAVILSDGVS